ncbi:HlyD family efflux transporter periplasmic adaptor subunit [Halioxenophilus aromaticivorans]|uniref:EmrA/EmrK family multidrug efflux transporter periplasmic adaptor subunit n=1 Tax=Halioxenophilus aromaticivorans TaxID=1306992 RepID=A0AAV3UA80_9ALTE
MSSETIDSNQPQAKRKTRLLFIALAVAVIAAAYASYWYLHGRHFVTTDNAYVQGNTLAITSEVNGTVIGVEVNNTEQVKQGQLLVSLDPTDAEIAVDSARAELARTVRAVRSEFAKASGLQSQIESQQTALDSAKEDLNRRLKVAEMGGVSSEELQHARSDVTRQQAMLATARDELEQVNAQIVGTTIETHPDVLAAAAKLREASLALQRTKIYAPVDGVVAQRSVEIGTRIAQGKPLLSVVPLGQVWVDANFKEVQLSQVKVGQPVTLESDLYGDSAEFHGRVVGLSAGTGSAFALLPAQNASGNWIKIVQRLPVRIALDNSELAEHPLRVGLSMTASIDVGAPLQSINEGTKVGSTMHLERDWDRQAMNDLVDEIIAEHSGGSATKGEPVADVALEAAL